MKTSIKTALATALTAVFLSTAAFTTSANDSIEKTVKASAMKVNMVVAMRKCRCIPDPFRQGRHQSYFLR